MVGVSFIHQLRGHRRRKLDHHVVQEIRTQLETITLSQHISIMLQYILRRQEWLIQIINHRFLTGKIARKDLTSTRSNLNNRGLQEQIFFQIITQVLQIYLAELK